ncbi:hypothetical protein [Pseudomonas sp. PD9R]|uniref:hypothetical protein n=1 Tax=Pseudomonas sp. PD9R TaxID=2853534 RepID=UPI001C46504D|nr:hypothetical protein [Pseudomonas sp. PD9R]MBV6826242.1 hypothetical protein [Pseudomonas sp. PD9R]
MSIFQRMVLLLKVLVMLSLSISAAWADCENHDTQAFSGQATHGDLMLAKSESEPGDQDQGGSKGDDDSTTDEPDSDDDDDGDSQT